VHFILSLCLRQRQNMQKKNFVRVNKFCDMSIYILQKNFLNVILIILILVRPTIPDMSLPQEELDAGDELIHVSKSTKPERQRLS